MKIFMFFKIFYLFFINILFVFGNENNNNNIAAITTRQDGIHYLLKFGYFYGLLDTSSDINIDKIPVFKVQQAILRFQDYAGLYKSGVLDIPTMNKMNVPRCGNPEYYDKNVGNSSRLLRYQFTGGVWKRKVLTYKITKFSRSGISEEEIARDVKKAFDIWSRETNLDFKRSTAKEVDLEIRFEVKDHGDGNHFDGRGIILAHAYNPPTHGEIPIHGDLHFDDDELWISGKTNKRGSFLLPVAVHEIGHSLGLSHSEVRDAIMYAFMGPDQNTNNVKLHADDIRGIQKLYGRKKLRPQEDPYQKDILDKFCKDPKVDAVTEINNLIYIFNGHYYIAFGKKDGKLIIEEANRIDNKFIGLGPFLNAAVTIGRITYFFKGDYYWRFKDFKMDGKFPRPIVSDFPDLPINIQAAFKWKDDDNIYFFKGDKYWAYNPKEIKPIASRFPLPIEQWEGLPKNIQGAVSLNDSTTFFFKDDQYWRFDENGFQVPESSPSYPRENKLMWFGCYNYTTEYYDL